MHQATVDAVCAYCHTSLGAGEAPRCPLCAAAHHEDCWDENLGCAVLGCAAGPDHVDEQQDIPTPAPTPAPAPAPPIWYPSDAPPAEYPVHAPPVAEDTTQAIGLPALRRPSEDDEDHDDGLTPTHGGTIAVSRRVLVVGLVVLLVLLPTVTALAARADLLAPVLGHLHTQQALDAATDEAAEAGEEVGYEEGERVGRAAGRTAGIAEGRERGRAEALSDVEAREAAEYTRGYEAGTAAAAQPGSAAYREAFEAGRDDALAEGTYQEGYDAGVASATAGGTYEQGYEMGRSSGYASGVACASYSESPYTDCTGS